MRIILFLAFACLASAQPVRLHFKPADHSLGDVHPFFHEGECFLYYLKPGKYDSMLVRSRDWLNWTPAALTHDPVNPDDWFSPYFVLGVFRDDAAQIHRSYHGHAQGRMVCSVSEDLIHWSCAPKEFHVPAGGYYERRRDPFVFWIPETKRYGCVMTTWIKGRPKDKGGAVSLATSADLKHWDDHGVVLDLVDQGEPECPQMFQLGPRWYLLTSIYAQHSVGRPVYYTAAQPLGPWTFGGALDGKDLCAAQIARDGDNELFLFGWIPLTPAKPEKQSWGGHLALVREVYALPDGKLATRLPSKLANAFDSLSWRAFDHEPPGERHDFAAIFELTMPKAAGELKFSFSPLGEVALAQDKLRILDGNGQCWSELAVELPASKPMPVRVFVEEDRVELFVHDRWSLCARVPAAASALSLNVSAGTATISKLRYAKLNGR